ncbi:hypothetical protein [Homoserinibacter sp. YIM 151385]|uniref:hypothetical protein n=1 Tax=Homoserinibacter sp. YIM 151385 TaxID=2985506 RepID=UPI0022F04411|nr:hypothetical protein [Homoserinibacter sp. YIM 151385]WBU36764.1 hypothetical protein OF852_07380 [Homoserinibacter sp. YIM 151385]
MHLHPARALATASIAAIGILGLAACTAPAEPEAAPAEETTSEETTAPEAPTAEGTPAWANPISTEGELIATITAGDITIEAYQLGTEKATKTGQFATPDGDPVIAEGDEIVFVNYAITNGGEAIDLSASLVSIDARYDDWPYMQGMDSVVDQELFEKQGVFSSGVATGGYQESNIYTLGAGEGFSFGENFPYQAGSPITFDVSITPIDAEGELIHDERVEAEGAGTIG